MFASRYYAGRYFHRRYFPALGGSVTTPTSIDIRFSVPDSRPAFCLPESRFKFRLSDSRLRYTVR